MARQRPDSNATVQLSVGGMPTDRPGRVLSETDLEQFAQRQGMDFLNELRKQDRVRVVLQWTREDEQNKRAGKPVPYPKSERVQINDVVWWVERGKAQDVPISIAEVLVAAGKIPAGVLPDGNEYRAWQEQEDELAERRAEQARIDKMVKAGLVPA